MPSPFSIKVDPAAPATDVRPRSNCMINPMPITLSKADARKAMVRHHFTTCPTQMDAFQRLRSIQFDPIAPVGCNHDLVLQARVPGYRVGDWQKITYGERLLYDGWDKQACLVPIEGWPLRRIFHKWHRRRFERVFEDHSHAIDAVLKELEERGPLMPKECNFQEHKPEWKDTWFGPSLSKNAMRALWYTGRVMTTGRRGGHHVYDLTERVVPANLFVQPPIPENGAIRELVMERHRAVGILRPSAAQEVWSLHCYAPARMAALAELVAVGQLVPVEVEGVKAHATPSFLSQTEMPSLEPSVRFIAPLDPFLWDRKMITHLFGFDYIWEIYVPEPKRRWGYYVLPVLYGDSLVARAEFRYRKGVLELLRWHSEPLDPGPGFSDELKRALYEFASYCTASSIRVEPGIDPSIRTVAESLALS